MSDLKVKTIPATPARSTTAARHKQRRGISRTGGCCLLQIAGPITKLFAWGERESGGHVLCDTTTEAGVDESDHHALVNAGERAERDIV